MNLKNHRWARVLTAGAAALALTMTLPVGTSNASTGKHGPHWDVVTSGLDSPRGLAVLPNGVLVVGEAGHGGSYCEGSGQNQSCFGLTSRISTVNPWNGKRRTLVGKLISAGGGEGFTGVDGVSTYGWNVYGIMTANPQTAPPTSFCTGQPAGCAATLKQGVSQVGRLIRANGRGGYTALANVGYKNYNYIATHPKIDPANPDFTPGDSNPYGVSAGRRGAYVVDAGSNTLDWVGYDGRIKILAYIPNPPGPPDQRFPYDAVPTCVVQTRNGVYIGDLSGRAWKYSHGHLRQLNTKGLTGSIQGCTADRSGNVYFVTMFKGFDPTFGFAPNTGSVTKIDTRGHASMYADGLNLPGGATFGRDRHLYVANNSICPTDTTGLPPQLCPTSGTIVRFDRS